MMDALDTAVAQQLQNMLTICPLWLSYDPSIHLSHLPIYLHIFLSAVSTHQSLSHYHPQPATHLRLQAGHPVHHKLERLLRHVTPVLHNLCA